MGGWACGFPFPPFSLPLAVSVLTLVSMVPILVLEHIRKGLVTSLLVVELGWVGFLWVLWLAAGGEAASTGVDASTCSRLNSASQTLCSSLVAITAFSFLNWIILLGWFGTLVTFGAINNHWNHSVPDTDLTKKHSTGAAGQPTMAAAPGATPYGAYPPQQAPQGYPQQQAQGYQGYPQQVQQGHPQAQPPMSGPVQHSSPGPTPGSVPV